MPSLLILRHFATPMNSGQSTVERSRGWSDVSIDKKEAEAPAGRAARLFDKEGVKTITSSDLPRGKQSADLVRSKMDDKPEVVTTGRARTWNTGQQGEVEKDAIEERKKYAKHPDEPMPEGESFNDFKNRYSAFMDNEIAQAEKHPDKQRAIIVHGHHSVATDAVMEERDLKASDWDRLQEIKPGDVARLSWDANGHKFEAVK